MSRRGSKFASAFVGLGDGLLPDKREQIRTVAYTAGKSETGRKLQKCGTGEIRTFGPWGNAASRNAAAEPTLP
jgi:hypothetical protein